MLRRLWTFASVAAWILAILSSTPSLAVEGQAGWERFQFVGNSTFSYEQLRTALVAEPGFLLAVHPHSDSLTIEQVTTRLLVAGYRNSGIESPQVEFKSTENGGGIITIDEGQRYRCGAVQITGAKKVNVERLAERLTEPSAKDDSFPTFVELHGETLTRWVDSKGKSVDLEKPTWPLGSHVKFDTESKISKRAIATFRDLGFSNAKVLVTIKPDVSDLTAELVVDILDEGPRAVADVFHVVGTQTNSPNAVLSFLELSPGVTVDQTLVQSITKRLWDCGRFKKHNVHFDRDENGRGRLNIELDDVKGVPGLSEPMSENAVVFMRARSWLNSVNDRNEDISFTFNDNGVELEVVQSQRGLIIQIRSDDNGQERSASEGDVHLSLIIDDSFVTVVNSRHATIWQADVSRFEGKIRLETNISVAEADEKFSTINLNGSCNSRRSEAESLFLSTLNSSPADWSGFAYKTQLQTHVTDGKLYVTRGQDRFEIDVASGQIENWTSDLVKTRIEASQFSRLKSQITQECTGKKNDYDAARPVSTLMGHMLRSKNRETICDLLRLQYDDRKPLEPSLATAITKLIDGDLLRPLDAFAVYSANNQGNNQFEIPYAPSKDFDFVKTAIQLVGKYGLKCAPEIFAEGTWPMSVTRETCLMMLGRAKHSGAVLEELLADSSNGPLCDASVAYLLSFIKQPGASMFAQRSLQKMNPESFRSDREILMSGPSGKWMAGVITACESLSDEEIESLRVIGLNDRMVAGLHAIRKQSESTDDGYWYQIAKHGLEGVLSSIVQR